MGNQLHPENLRGVGSDFVQRFGHLDAAALASSAGVNLRLDDPDLAAQRLCGLDRVINRKTRNASRNAHAIAFQEFFALVFMDFHGGP